MTDALHTPARAACHPAIHDAATGLPVTKQGAPNRRALSKLRTHEKVIQGARFMFINVGYEATTIRDLAKRIGMSTGAVFANFEDKAELYRAAMGAPPPTLDLADEIGLILSLYPGWRYLLRFDGGRCIANLSSPDYNAVSHNGQTYTATADSPATAMRQARLQAERHDDDRRAPH